ncbi:GntR family transcriptional regulator [Chelatococcus reniformis]|uniref:HTH gntR-type domain-containing protein n=1 Tax=Chelatococcus reniformis TaxID=1494448 RepID=A0A916UWT8_9HYPH|nr:GntR family transcriptional regulator [Chelatococcus reniformis]GGC92262.1 hypothetical protein GCM10010994_57620 [Chelatococcus reniformis]
MTSAGPNQSPAATRAGARPAEPARAAMTRGESVLSKLRNGILREEHAGGQHMNEAELASRLGCSRTPVRSALSVLAAEGLLTYTPNAGYVVRTYSAKDIADIFEVRCTLEGLANRQAAEAGLSDAQFGQLRGILAATDELLARNEWSNAVCDRWIDLNQEFHTAIFLASGNRHLCELLARIQKMPVISNLRYSWFNRDIVSHAHDDHLALCDALRERQATRAESLGREHIYRTTRIIIDLCKRREAEASAEDAGQPFPHADGGVRSRGRGRARS